MRLPRLRPRRPTYANVAATLALVIAASTGGAYAHGMIGSSQIKENAVKSRHIAKQAVKTPDIKAKAVTQAKLAPNAKQLNWVKRPSGFVNRTFDAEGCTEIMSMTVTAPAAGLLEVHAYAQDTKSLLRGVIAVVDYTEDLCGATAGGDQGALARLYQALTYAFSPSEFQAYGVPLRVGKGRHTIRVVGRGSWTDANQSTTVVLRSLTAQFSAGASGSWNKFTLPSSRDFSGRLMQSN